MAQTYKFGNGTWARKKGSTLAYSDTNNAFKPLPFSFERDSIATRVNKEGLIEVVGNDIPRIDYTDSTEGALLLENSATNLITYSEDFTQWAIQSATITANNEISPDGTLNADKFTRTAINNNLRFINSISGNYTFSVFLKADTKNWALLYINYSGGTDGQVYVDLENGVIGTIIGTDNEIKDFGNGWFKVSVTFTTPTALSDVRIVIADGDGVISGSDGSIYIWGAMLEANSVASSYIPTNGSTVQRAAETCNESGNSEVFNDSEGVLFADISALANDGTTRMITLSDSTSANRTIIKYDNIQNRLEFFVIKDYISEYVFITTVNDLLTYNKIALKYKQDDFSLFFNGFELNSSTSGSTYSDGTLTELAFDGGDGNSDFYGKTKEIAYYDEILTDLELETLTSYRSLNEMVTELNLNAL